MPALSTVFDTFSAATINTGFWPTDYRYGVVDQTGGVLRAQAISSYSGVATGPFYTFDATPWVKIVAATKAAGSTATSVNTYVILTDPTLPAGTDININIDTVAGTLTTMFRDGYWDGGANASRTYNATSHAWVRIRRTGTTVVFESAPNSAGVPGTATTLRSATLPATHTVFSTSTQVSLGLGAGADTAATPNYGTFDMPTPTAKNVTDTTTVSVANVSAVTGTAAKDVSDTTTMSLSETSSISTTDAITQVTVTDGMSISTTDPTLGITALIGGGGGGGETPLTAPLTVDGDGDTTSGWGAEGGDYTRVQSDDDGASALYSPILNDVRQFSLTDTSGLGSATITSVTVYAKLASIAAYNSNTAIGVRVNGADYYSGDKTATSATYTMFSQTWTLNPATSAAWTAADLDALQIGVKKTDGNGTRLTYMAAEVAYTTGPAQSFYPLTPVDVTPATLSSWTTVDVSAYLPAGASGAILQVINIHASTSYSTAVRKTGSTDARLQSVGYGTHSWTMVGVDVNRTFQQYHTNANIQIWLMGYTTSGVTYFTNAVDKSLSAYNAWTDINCSDVVPSNAIGLIFEVYGGSASQAMGLRMNGSTDARTNTFFRRNTMGAVIGCDAGQIVEGYAGTLDVDFWLVGYITDGAMFYTNAVDASPVGTGAYENLPALPTGAVMGFYEVSCTTTYAYALRPDGSTEDFYQNAMRHPWAIISAGPGGLVEGKVANTDVKFSLVGYAGPPSEPPPPAEYPNYAALAAAYTEGVDYQIITTAGSPRVSHIAIHGGGIEAGTGEAARAAAALDGTTHYRFEGIMSSGNSALHITSTAFDEPQAIAVQNSVHRTVSWHGAAGSTPNTVIGGLDTALRDAIITRLQAAGFATTLADEATYPEIAGVDPNNISNRNTGSAGVQLEITLAQREAFFPGGDTSRTMRESESRTADFTAYVAAVVQAVEDVAPLLAPSDTPTVTATEVRVVAATSATADIVSTALTESAAVAISRVVTVSDTVTPAVSEVRGLAAATARTDAVTLGITESGPVDIALARSDTTTVSATEVGVLAKTSASADAMALSLQESAAVEILQAVTVSDAAAMSAGESATTVGVGVSRGDSPAVAVTESSAVAVTQTNARTDTMVLSLTESAAIVVQLARTDTLTADTTEIRVLAATSMVADVLTTSTPESRALQVSVSRSDVVAPAIVDTGTFAVAAACVDSVAVSSDDSVITTAGLDLADDAVLSVGDTSSGAPLDVTFIGPPKTNAANAATYTYTAVPLGAESPDRTIILGVSGKEANGYVTTVVSATVGGVPAIRDIYSSGTAGAASAMFHVPYPTGTTADIVLTFSQVVMRSGITVYRSVGNTAVVADVGTVDSAVGGALDMTLTGHDGGVAVLAAHVTTNSAGVPTWTNAVQDSFAYEEGNNGITTASSPTTDGDTTYTITPPAGWTYLSLSGATYAPDVVTAVEVTKTDFITAVPVLDSVGTVVTEARSLAAASGSADTTAVTVFEASGLAVTQYVMVTDAAAVAVSEAVSLGGSRFLSVGDTVTASATEARAVSTSSGLADVATVNAQDGSSLAILTAKMATDSVVLSAGEATQLAVAFGRADSAVVAVVDSASPAVGSSSADDVAPDVLDVAEISSSTATTDAVAVSAVESATVDILRSLVLSDVLTVSLADVRTIAAVSTRSDVATISVPGTAATGAALAAADAAGVTITEARTNAATLNRSDAVVVSAAVENASVIGSITSADDVLLTFTDILSVPGGLAGSDQILLPVADTVAVSGTAEAGDDIAVSIADTAAVIMGRAPLSDTPAISTTATVAVFGTVSRDDTTTLVLVESAVVDITTRVNTADVFTVVATEAGTVTGAALTSASDTAFLTLTETSAVTTASMFPVQDTITLGLAETAVVRVEVSAEDTYSVVLHEVVQLAAGIATTDTVGMLVVVSVAMRVGLGTADLAQLRTAEAIQQANMITAGDAIDFTLTDFIAIWAPLKQAVRTSIAISVPTPVMSHTLRAMGLWADMRDTDMTAQTRAVQMFDVEVQLPSQEMTT